MEAGVSLQSLDKSLKECDSSTNASKIRRHCGTDSALRLRANWISVGFNTLSDLDSSPILGCKAEKFNCF